MKILATDASTKIISISVLDDKKPQAGIHKQFNKSQGSALIPTIKKLLDKTRYNITDIDLFCVGLGPGSFTGLRISLGAMRTLSIALKKPIIGIPSFDAIAYGLALDTRYSILNTYICVMFDAKQNKVYARFYKHMVSGIRPASPFLLDGFTNIIKKIKQKTIIAGDAIPLYGSKIPASKKDIILFARESKWYPRAEFLGVMALDKYKKGLRADPFKLLPLYIYPKECQVRR